MKLFKATYPDLIHPSINKVITIPLKEIGDDLIEVRFTKEALQDLTALINTLGTVKAEII